MVQPLVQSGNDFVDETGFDVTCRTCFDVVLTITASPSTGVNTNVVAEDNEENNAHSCA